MVMTDEQKYNAVLKELGEVLQSKNTTISCQRWQIDQLKEKLEAAEKELTQEREYGVTIEDALTAAEVERDSLRRKMEAGLLLDQKTAALLREANAELLKCVDMGGRVVMNDEKLFDLQGKIQHALQQLETGGAA